MTEQDDLFGQKKQQQEGHENGFVASVDDVAGGGIAAGEVRLVSPAAPAQSSKLLILLLLLVVLVGGYLLFSAATTPIPVQPITASKQPIPARTTAVVPVQPQRSEPPVQPQRSEPPVQPQRSEPPVLVAVEKSSVIEPSVGSESSPAAVVTAPEAEIVKTVVVATGAEPVYSVQVGPFLSKLELQKATKQLQSLGFAPHELQGRGTVAMTRLLEGRYPETEARQRLAQLIKQGGDAFILPDGDKWAIYVGSFSDSGRAVSSAAQLAKKGVKVTLVTSDLEMSGSLLVAVQGEQATARQSAELINRSGLKTRIVRK